jgi:predicted Zn-dependent protease
MRKLTIPCLVAAFVASACGDKHPRSGDANAAEVTTASSESASVTTPISPSATGPVSFADAKAAYAGKRYDESVRLLTTYTTEHPDNVWGYYMLGLSAWKAGDRDAAVSALRLAIEKDSTHVKSRLNLSRVLIEQGKATEALPQVEAALRIDSTSNEVYRLLGRVKDELGDPASATEAFQRAIVLDPSDVWSMNNLAWVFIGQHQFDAALGPLARAIELDSTVATFQNNLGIALEGTGRVVQAASAYRSALAIDSAYRKATVNLARVDGRTQDPAITQADLNALAHSFVEQVKTWR